MTEIALPAPGTIAAGSWSAALDRVLARPACWAAAVLAVVAVQLTLTFGHRPWLDEYQALQIALQSPDLAGLLGNLRYEGHPPLFYLLLRGVAALVPVALVLPVTAAAFGFVTQATILVRAPFARAERLALATSAFVFFEYNTLSRSLTLGVALLLLAFAFRDRRAGWIALALLPMADFLFGVLSLVVLAIRWRERRWWWPGVAAWAAIGLLAAWTVRPAADMVPAFLPGDAAFELGAWLNNLSILLLPIQTLDGRLAWNGPLPFGLASLAGPLFVVFGLRTLRGDPFHLALWSGFLALTLAFSLFAYPLAIRHLSLLALLLILLVWRSREREDAIPRPVRWWFAALSACGLLSAGIALTRPFDTATEAAAEIRRLGLTQAHWIAFPDSRGQGVAALTGIAFQKLGRDCLQQFVRWNYRSPIRRGPQLERALQELAAGYGRLHLLTDFPVDGAVSHSVVRRLAHIPAGYDDQPFYLYVVRPDLPETTRRPAACVPGQRALDWNG